MLSLPSPFHTHSLNVPTFSPCFSLSSSQCIELVANRFLEEVELSTDERSATVTICKHFHQSTRELSEKFLAELGRHNYVTPTSYLELISSFKNILATSRGTIMKMKNRYVVGLDKLNFAASQVQCTWQPRTLKVVGSSPTLGSVFSLKGCCLGIDLYVFVLSFTSILSL